MDGIKKHLIILLTNIFLHLHNLSASAQFGAGNIVLEKNAERWIDSKMIMIIRQVWVLNWFLCYWFKSKKKRLAWIASASKKCSQCTVFVFVKFCLVMHSVNVFLENWYFGHYLPTNIIISSLIFNISILYTYTFIYMILAIKSVYISNI